MTSLSPSASRTRAGMLILGLALVGGTGCAIIEAANNARYNNMMRERAQAREHRIAELTPAANRGDPAAMTQLAEAMTATPDPNQVDAVRVLDLLSRAAATGYAPAQAVLGQTLATGRVSAINYKRMPPESRDIERGVVLLRQAATQACTYRFDTFGMVPHTIHPALELSRLLQAHSLDEDLLWRARDILHCAESHTQDLAWRAKATGAPPEDRINALALLSLTPDSKAIAEARASMPAEQVAAAERESADLRRRVVESERQYPSPTHKELP